MHKFLPALALVLAGSLVLAASPTPPAAPPTSPPVPTEPAALPVTRITLHANNMPVNDILKELNAQCDFKFSIATNFHWENTPVSIDVSRQPLWDTLNTLLTRASPTPTIGFNMADKVSDTAGLYRGRVSTSGPFLILATDIRREINYDRAGPDADQIVIKFIPAIDPAINLAYLAATSGAATAVDDLGNSLAYAGPTPGATVLNTLSLKGRTPTFATLLLSPPPGKKLGKVLTRVEGNIPAALATLEVVEVKRDESNDLEFGGIPAHFSVAPQVESPIPQYNPPRREASVIFNRPASMSDADWAAADRRLAATRILMVNKDGREWTASVGTSATATSRTVRISGNPPSIGFATYKWDSEGLEKVTFHVPVSVQAVSIPYAFENLPLP